MITITGGSDDLIEIDGDIREEFNWSGAADAGDDESRFVACSDGTVLRVVYDKDGIWRFTKVSGGSAKMTKVDGDPDADTFDVVTLDGEIKWVVFATHVAKS